MSSLSFPLALFGSGSEAIYGAVEVMVPFSGAGDKLLWVGPGRIMELVLTTAANGSIELTDESYTGSPIAAWQTITTTAGALEATSFNSGAGRVVYSGVTLAVTGASAGYVLMRSE